MPELLLLISSSIHLFSWRTLQCLELVKYYWNPCDISNEETSWHWKTNAMNAQAITVYLFDPVFDDRGLGDGDVLPGGGGVKVELPQDLLLDVLLRHLLEQGPVLCTPLCKFQQQVYKSRWFSPGAVRCFLRCRLLWTEPSLKLSFLKLPLFHLVAVWDLPWWEGRESSSSATGVTAQWIWNNVELQINRLMQISVDCWKPRQ